MIEKLVNLYIVNQLNMGMITKENINVYRYGYTLMFEMLINVIIAFIIGFFFHELSVVTFFLLSFIPLRSYCGGYHAPKAWMCVLLSNTFIIVVILFSENMDLNSNINFMFLVEIVCIGLIILMAPIQSPSKKLNENERILYKKYIRLILVIQLIIEMFFFAFGLNKFGNIIIISHVIQLLALNLALYERIKKKIVFK